MDINDMVAEAHGNGVRHGFWDGQRLLGADRVTVELNTAEVLKTIPEKLCLIHSEVSEALEEYRQPDTGLPFTAMQYETALRSRTDDPTDGRRKPVGFASELADILLRVGDLAGALGIDLDAAVIAKMRYNASRPYKHGKVC